jgi:hypothetical protein
MGCLAEQMFTSQNMSLLSSAFVMYSVVKSIHFKDKCPCSVPYFLAQLPKDHQLVTAFWICRYWLWLTTKQRLRQEHIL